MVNEPIFVKTRRELITQEPTRWIDLNIKDRTGAAAGLLVYRSLELYVTDDGHTREPQDFVYFVPAGVWFCATVRTARDAKPFGAINSGHLDRTREERERWIDAYVRKTRSKYLSLKRRGRL